MKFSYTNNNNNMIKGYSCTECPPPAFTVGGRDAKPSTVRITFAVKQLKSSNLPNVTSTTQGRWSQNAQVQSICSHTFQAPTRTDTLSRHKTFAYDSGLDPAQLICSHVVHSGGKTKSYPDIKPGARRSLVLKGQACSKSVLKQLQTLMGAIWQPRHQIDFLANGRGANSLARLTSSTSGKNGARINNCFY